MAAAAGKVLLVDDEVRLLNAARRGMREVFDLHTALGPKEALATLKREGPFAVIVTDMGMPGMNGIEFLKAAEKIAPDTVNIMLTGNGDLEVATEAFNEGDLFRYFTKPCSGDRLTGGIRAALRQHQLVIAEKQLLTQTLSGTIKLLTNVLATLDPVAFARSGQIRRWLGQVKGRIELKKSWSIDMAAMLSPIGACTLPPQLLAKAQARNELNDDERELVANIPQATVRLLSSIPRMDDVTAIITLIPLPQSELREQEASLSPTVAMGAKLLHILTDLAERTHDGETVDQALVAMVDLKNHYDNQLLTSIMPVLLKAAADDLAGSGEGLLKLGLKELKPGDILHSNIVTKDSGKLVLSTGHELNEVILERIMGGNGRKLILEPILIERPSKKPQAPVQA